MEYKYRGREEEYRKEYYQSNKEKWKKHYNNKDAFICVYRLVGKNNDEILRIGSTLNLKTRIANYMSGNVINDIKLKEWRVYMGIIVAIFVGFVTLSILGISNADKASNQLMLLGIEITIVGAVFLIMFYFSNSFTLYYLGVVLIVSGFTVNIFGFNKKQ